MADLIPRWVVALRVALALSGPMQNLSANRSAVIFVCRSPETNVRLDAGSSIDGSLFVRDWLVDIFIC
jgi:hypothetical protein